MPPAETTQDDSVLSHTDVVRDKKWINSFPQSLSDESSSSKFMIRAMFVAFSCIIRYRNILGDECFKSNYITEKLKIRSLSFENKQSLYVSQLLRSASDAIKEGVLEELAMVVTENEGDAEALEVFSWKMHYDIYNNPSAEFNQVNETGGSVVRQLAKIEYAGSNSVRDQLVILVRSIQVLCQKLLQPLDEKAVVSFRISYLPHTRPEYRVDGFKDVPIFYTLSEDCQSASVGQLRPGHHASDLSCSSVYLTDSYEAESVLKKYADRLADSLGYDRLNTLYQSFLSNETQTISDAQITSASGVTPEQAKQSASDETDKLSAKVEAVRLGNTKETPSPDSENQEKASTRTRRKRGPATVESQDVPQQSQTKPNEPKKKQALQFGRVRSVSKVSPEKRSRRS